MMALPDASLSHPDAGRTLDAEVPELDGGTHQDASSGAADASNSGGPPGCATVGRSLDGVTWQALPRSASTCVHTRSLAFDGERFVIGTDDGNWYASTDGDEWALFRKEAGTFVVMTPDGLSGPTNERNAYRGRGICLHGGGSPNHGIFRSQNPDCAGSVRMANTPANVTTFLFGHVPADQLTRGAMPEPRADCLGL